MARRDMDRWLGDGGMAVIGALGASFDAYGVDGEDLGWVTGGFEPTALAANPHGAVQAGVHAVLLDAAMNFAINSALSGADRTAATVELSTQLVRAARVGERYALRGEVVRLARDVAHAEASVTSSGGDVVSRGAGTFLLHREPVADPDAAH